LATCDSAMGDELTENLTAREDTIPPRDFTGLDCTGWVYDLFRRDEPYAARGTHPSGVGIDRYIRPSDLTREERRYLSRQVLLSSLNVVSPAFVSQERLPGPEIGGERSYWTFGFGHHMTSYGHRLLLDLFVDALGHRALVGLRTHHNQTLVLPGLELALFREPVRGGEWPVALTARVEGWLQPERQRFLTDATRFGGLVSVLADVEATEHTGFYIEALAKTPGWTPGVVYLQRAFEARAGVMLML
jgi:hypothetical protein